MKHQKLSKKIYTKITKYKIYVKNVTLRKNLSTHLNLRKLANSNSFKKYMPENTNNGQIFFQLHLKHDDSKYT